MCVSFIGNTTEMIAAFLGIVSYTPPKKSFFDNSRSAQSRPYLGLSRSENLLSSHLVVLKFATQLCKTARSPQQRFGNNNNNNEFS
jgi:hypothetical protein